MLSHFSHVQLFATLWTVARQAPLSMIFSRKEPWRGWPCPPPGDLPNPGIKPMSLHCGGFFTTEALGKPSLPTLEMVKSPCQAHTGGQANVNSTTFLASTHPLPLCCPQTDSFPFSAPRFSDPQTHTLAPLVSLMHLTFRRGSSRPPPQCALPVQASPLKDQSATNSAQGDCLLYPSDFLSECRKIKGCKKPSVIPKKYS